VLGVYGGNPPLRCAFLYEEVCLRTLHLIARAFKLKMSGLIQGVG
jgi:hypothetical protein